MEKFQVLLNEEATAEYERLLKIVAIRDLAKRYLKDLFDFPPDAWGDIHRKEGLTLFKSDNHVIFDIQGKVLIDETGKAHGVKISRFRLRHKE